MKLTVFLDNTYTAKLLFHQSPTRHSDCTLTGQGCRHCWQLLAAGWLSCQWQCSYHAASHCAVTLGDWWNRSFIVYQQYKVYKVHLWDKKKVNSMQNPYTIKKSVPIDLLYISQNASWLEAHIWVLTLT